MVGEFDYPNNEDDKIHALYFAHSADNHWKDLKITTIGLPKSMASKRRKAENP